MGARRLRISLALSALLHLCFGLVFWLKDIPRDEQRVFVELTENPPPDVRKQAAKPLDKKKHSKLGTKSQRTGSVRESPRHQRERLSIKSLVPSFRPTMPVVQGDGAIQSPSDEAADSLAVPSFDEPRGYMISAASYDQGNARRGFLGAVYERINGHLIFDSILAQYDHFGVVYLEFEVSRTGLLIEDSLRVSAKNPILKVHVIRSALLPALSRKLEENLWLKGEEKLKLRARFQFIRSSAQNTLFDENPEKIIGLAFSFRRFTEEKRVARNLSEHLSSGGLSYDVFKMYEAWEKYNLAQARRRMQYDPFELYRADKYYN